MSELEKYEPREVETIAPNDPTGGRLVAWAAGLKAAHQIGTALCQTAFAPKHFAGKPEESAAAILYGDEIGFTPTQALRSIYVIGGAPALYARAMVALVLAHGHEVWTEEDTPTKVTVSGRRKGSRNIETVTWTADRARKAGYTSNKKYESDPQAMLYARSSGDVARRVAPDVLAGVAYTVEEMELLDEPATVTKTRTTKTKTAKRETVEPPTPEEPALDEPDQAPISAPDEDAKRNSEPDALDVFTPITEPQTKKMGALMREVDLTERQACLDYVARVVGREVGSRNELSKEEASQVIEALEADKAAVTVVQDGFAEPTLDPTEGEGWGS